MRCSLQKAAIAWYLNIRCISVFTHAYMQTTRTFHTYFFYMAGLYFSALWCPPCRMFTPKLKNYYNRLAEKGNLFEVVFVSSDSDQEAFDEYFQEMPWAALSYECRELRVSVKISLYHPCHRYVYLKRKHHPTALHQYFDLRVYHHWHKCAHF